MGGAGAGCWWPAKLGAEGAGGRPQKGKRHSGRAEREMLLCSSCGQVEWPVGSMHMRPHSSARGQGPLWQPEALSARLPLSAPLCLTCRPSGGHHCQPPA